jgi:hypothetical protein
MRDTHRFRGTKSAPHLIPFRRGRDLQPEHPVDLVPLLPRESVETFRHAGGHVPQQGVPVRLQLLLPLSADVQDLKLGLCGLAGVFELLEPLSELVKGHKTGGLLVLVGGSEAGSGRGRKPPPRPRSLHGPRTLSELQAWTEKLREHAKAEGLGEYRPG